MGLKGGEKRNFDWKNFGHSNAFVMLKATFSKHSLIKINMTCVHIKPEVKQMIHKQRLQLQIKLL